MVSIDVQAFRIPPAGALDGIDVIWRNDEPGRGSVTITCWGSAWTCYFGGMCGETIQQFFARADTSYLVSKLGITPHLKGTKKDQQYLARVIDAVKTAMSGAGGSYETH